MFNQVINGSCPRNLIAETGAIALYQAEAFDDNVIGLPSIVGLRVIVKSGVSKIL